MVEANFNAKRFIQATGFLHINEVSGYELVTGHRYHRASELAEKESMSVIAQDMDDDVATILMVESNLQRGNLCISHEAGGRQTSEARTDLTSGQVGSKLIAAEKIVESSPDSKSQIKRYIRLTELMPELLDMVDEWKIALSSAYELSFLQKKISGVAVDDVFCDLS